MAQHFYMDTYDKPLVFSGHHFFRPGQTHQCCIVGLLLSSEALELVFFKSESFQETSIDMSYDEVWKIFHLNGFLREIPWYFHHFSPSSFQETTWSEPMVIRLQGTSTPSYADVAMNIGDHLNLGENEPTIYCGLWMGPRNHPLIDALSVYPMILETAFNHPWCRISLALAHRNSSWRARWFPHGIFHEKWGFSIAITGEESSVTSWRQIQIFTHSICIPKDIVHRDIIWRFRQEEIDAVDDTWTFFSIFSISFVAPGCRNELGKVEEAKELFCKAKEAPVSPKIPELDDGNIGNPWKSYGNHMEIPKVGDKQMIKKHDVSLEFWDKTHDFPWDFLLKQSVVTSLVDLWRWRTLNGCDSSSVSMGETFFRQRIYGIFVVGYFWGVNQPPSKHISKAPIVGLWRVNLNPQQTRTSQLELAIDHTHRVKSNAHTSMMS